MIRNTFIALLLLTCACAEKATTEIRVTEVKKGTFLEELTEEGTIEAVNSISVNAPVISYRYGALKIAKIVDDGQEVKKGDTIMILDPSEIKRGIIQAEQQLEIANAEYEKLRSTQLSEIEDLEADLEIARISQEIARLEYESSIYEPKVTQREINLKLESATIALNRAKEQIENKKKIHKEDLLQKNLSIKQLTTTLNDAKNSLNSLFVVSPANGITIKEHNWNTGQKWAVGDQPYSGSQLIELPDLSEMRANIEVNEVDVSKVLSGQRVEIRPDAYSDSAFTGKVESVANLARNKDYKSKIKIFPVQIRISGQSQALLPGLTVSCRIIVSELHDVLYIPIESLFEEAGEEFVYVKSGSGFAKRVVKTGAVNSNWVLITEGLEEKESVALSDPFLNKSEYEEKEGKNGNKNSAGISKL